MATALSYFASVPNFVERQEVDEEGGVYIPLEDMVFDLEPSRSSHAFYVSQFCFYSHWPVHVQRVWEIVGGSKILQHPWDEEADTFRPDLVFQTFVGVFPIL